MPLTIRYFAAAQAARGLEQETLDIRTTQADTLAELIHLLGTRHTEHRASGRSLAEVLARCSLLLDGRRAEPSAPVPESGTLDVLPPFAGG